MDYVDVSAHTTWEPARSTLYRWGVFSVSADVDFEHKISIYQQMSRVKPDSFQAWSHLGYYLAQAGHYREAVGTYARAIYIQARAPRVWYNYATLIEKLGW
mgnify:FL=1